jgi:ABC-type antimicrobial peptide transport system permease subunit
MVIVGLYGVLSQLVNRRRQEIGVRMALGATSESILALILRQGSFLIAVGLGAGILAALGSSQLISSFLYGVRPMDVWSYLATAILLGYRAADGRSSCQARSEYRADAGVKDRMEG